MPAQSVEQQPTSPQPTQRPKTVPCPFCDRTFSAQGIAGHMRWQHSREKPTMAKNRNGDGSRKSRPDVNPGGQRLLALIAQLRGFRRQRQDLEASKPGFFEDPDDTFEDCLEALSVHELKVRNQIRKLIGKRPLERVVEPGLLGDSVTTRERDPDSLDEVDDEPDVDVELRDLDDEEDEAPAVNR